jgi:hypothetical protein
MNISREDTLVLVKRVRLVNGYNTHMGGKSIKAQFGVPPGSLLATLSSEALNKAVGPNEIEEAKDVV